MAAGNIACIDVGSTKICTLVANVSDENIIEIHWGVVDWEQGKHPLGILKGIITDLAYARRAIAESVEKAEQAGAPKVERAWVGFSGRHIKSQNRRVSVAIEHHNHLVTQAALRRGHIDVQKITFPPDRRPLPAIPTQYFLDGINIKNPLGMHGFRLDVEAHIITAGEAPLLNIKDAMPAGLAIEGIIVNPLACGEAVLEDEDKEAGVILADIGGGTTDIAVFKEGGIWHTSVLPVGGIQVSRDIASGLGIPFSVAEKFKIEEGNLLLEGEGWVEREGYKVSYEELCYILRARIEEILRMILLELPLGYMPTTMVLTGGTAKLSGMEEFAREVLGLRVRIEKPKGIPEAARGLEDLVYATSAGLLLWGARQEEMSIAIPPSAFTITLSNVGSALGRGASALGSIPSRLLSAMGYERRRKE